MRIQKRNIRLTVGDSLMRVYVAAPEPAGQYPGIATRKQLLSILMSLVQKINLLQKLRLIFSYSRMIFFGTLTEIRSHKYSKSLR